MNMCAFFRLRGRRNVRGSECWGLAVIAATGHRSAILVIPTIFVLHPAIKHRVARLTFTTQIADRQLRRGFMFPIFHGLDLL